MSIDNGVVVVAIGVEEEEGRVRVRGVKGVDRLRRRGCVDCDGSIVELLVQISVRKGAKKRLIASRHEILLLVLFTHL